LVTIATAVLLAVDIYFDIPHLIFAYLLPILFVAIKFGHIPALITAAVSGLCAAFFLYEPTLNLYIEDGRDVAELASFCALAAMISYFFGKGSRTFAVRRL
jgi:K+-sensing histidine kinase KdpD